MEERRIICRDQTEPWFVSGPVSRPLKGPNSGLFECHRPEFEAVGFDHLFLAAQLVVTPKNDDAPLSPHSQKADYFNTPVGKLTQPSLWIALHESAGQRVA